MNAFDSQELSDGDDRRHARKKYHLVKGETKPNFLYDHFKKWKMELSGTVGGTEISSTCLHFTSVVVQVSKTYCG